MSQHAGLVGKVSDVQNKMYPSLIFMQDLVLFFITRKNCTWLENYSADLMQEGKRITSGLRRRAEFPDGFDSPADNLRKKTLTAENTLMEIQRNMDALNYHIASLEDEKRMLSKEAAKYPTPEVRA